MSRISKVFITVMIMSLSLNAMSAGKERGKHRKMGIMKELDLSAEQRKELKEFRKSSKESKKTTRAEIKSLREQMKKSFQSNASESSLKSMHEKLKTLRSNMADFRFNKMLKIRSILTPDQRAKFYELRSKRKKQK